MGIFRGPGGTGDATTDAIASQVSVDSATASAKATEAANSASQSATSAANSATSATNAGSSETNAATSASNSASSATASANSATSAASILTSINAFYLGSASSNPTVDGNGDAVTAGDWYFNTSDNTTRIYTGSTWNIIDAVGATNVAAAGALMDSELTDITAVKALNQGVATTDTPTFAGLATSANVTFGDNDKAIFGAGSDLQIYHDGSNSYIQDQGLSGTGNLILAGADVEIATFGGNKYFQGASNIARLYHTNNEKLATTATGINVTGSVTADGLTVDGDSTVNGTIAIAGTSPKIFFSESDTTDLNTRVRSNGGNFQVQTVNNSDASPVTRLNIQNSTGDISFYDSAGSSQSLFWDASAEALGLGTTSPSNDLHIKGAGAANIRLEQGNGSNYGLIKQNQTSQLLQLGVGGSFGINIDSSNKVGIGTSSPAEPLHVQEGSSGITSKAGTVALIEGSANTKISIASGTTSTGELLFGSSADNDAGRIVYDHSDDGLQLWTNGARAVDIDSSGNVGIGTSSPNAPLEVSGAATTSTDIAHFSNSNGVQKAVISVDGEGDGQITLIDAGNNTDVLLTAGGVSYINTGGNFGIGTSSPSNPLHVATASTDVAKFATTGAYNFITLDNATRNWALSVGSTFSIYDNTAASTRMSVDSSGNLLVGKTSAAIAGAGTAILSSGTHNVTVDGDTTLQLNRLSSDGAIATFFKDSSSVGSIGTKSGDLIIGTDVAGLRFVDNDVALVSHNVTTNAGANGTLDLGINANRFKDLYLSGDVNLANNSQITFASTSCNIEGNSSGADFIKFTTGNAERMRIDSSGHVGIAHTDFTNYSGKLVVADGSVGGSSFIDIHNNNNNQFVKIGINNNTALIAYDNADEIAFGQMADASGTSLATEHMRIDASGNLLVGKSSSSFTTAGVELAQGGTAGKVQIQRSSSPLTLVNLTDDGSILSFYKGTTAVGSIGVINSNNLRIGGTVANHAGIQFGTNIVIPESGGSAVDAGVDLGYASGRFKDLYLSGGVRGTSTIDITIPETSGGAINLEFGNSTNTTRRTVQAYKDNFEPAAADTGVISLGQAGNKWKDLYLSGGVYLGGTSSSDYLEDYEKGTFSPVLADATTGGNASSTGAEAFYTKIGRQVFLSIHFYNIDTTGLTSGNDIFIQSLPFTSKAISGSAYYTGTMYSSFLTFTRTENCYPVINDNQSYIRLGFNRDGAGFDGQQVNGIASGSTDISINISYISTE